MMDVLLLLMLLAFMLIGLAARRTILINHEGIRIRSLLQRGVVRWETAKLFSLPYTKSSLAEIWSFELADVHAIVSWSYIRESGFLHERATLPYDEYNRLVDALNGYIVARTGLALYDLRAAA